jgi:spermidine synthase
LQEFSEEKSILFHGKSKFQEIMVFRSAQYGNVLVIDGIVQLTERDEFAFHEMMVHLPLFSHSNPKRVLIVGGGDGASLREVCRHPEVEHITLVEIDPLVIQVSKQHLSMITPPELFDDPRVEIVLADAAEFLQDPINHNRYDVIIADMLDPLGPAESLFQPEFYEAMHAALRVNGICCTQGECMWIHLNLIRDLVGCCAEIFDNAEYVSTMVPSFPCGQIGFVLARKGQQRSCRIPVRRPKFQSDLKWYNSELHRAAFVLPQYLKEELAPLNLLNRPRKMDDGEEDDCFLGQCTLM